MLGNVFSPWYARARAVERAPDPLAFSTMNVALYGPGARWSLTERGASEVRRDRESLVIGASAMRWERDALVVDLVERPVSFPKPVRGGVRGRVTLRPRFVHGEPLALDGEGKHQWWAVAPSARVSVELDEPGLRWEGDGYHDANAGDEALERAFSGWGWSRVVRGDEAVVLYDRMTRAGERRLHGMRYRDGRAEAVEAPRWSELPASRWGVARATRGDVGHDARVLRTLTDAPFYARSVVKTHLLGREVEAMHESVDLDRFQSPWVQFLLPFKMRRG